MHSFQLQSQDSSSVAVAKRRDMLTVMTLNASKEQVQCRSATQLRLLSCTQLTALATRRRAMYPLLIKHCYELQPGGTVTGLHRRPSNRHALHAMSSISICLPAARVTELVERPPSHSCLCTAAMHGWQSAMQPQIAPTKSCMLHMVAISLVRYGCKVDAPAAAVCMRLAEVTPHVQLRSDASPGLAIRQACQPVPSRPNPCASSYDRSSSLGRH